MRAVNSVIFAYSMRKRRTRKEKIIATLHRKIHSQSVVTHTTATTIPVQLPKTTTVISSHSIYPIRSMYFITDLKKSLLLTSAIVALELLLFFILQKKIFGLSNIGF